MQDRKKEDQIESAWKLKDHSRSYNKAKHLCTRRTKATDHSITVKSRPLATLVDKPQTQIMCQKPDKTLIPIDKLQVYFMDVVKCVIEVCSQR